MRHDEQRLQTEIAILLSWLLPPEVAWTAFPAGGGGQLRGKILKGMGLRSGWPDLQFVHEGRYYGIEIKPPKGVLTGHQPETHAAIIRAGGSVAIARSIADVEQALKVWGIPTREHKPSRERIRRLAADLAHGAGEALAGDEAQTALAATATRYYLANGI